MVKKGGEKHEHSSSIRKIKKINGNYFSVGNYLKNEKMQFAKRKAASTAMADLPAHPGK